VTHAAPRISQGARRARLADRGHLSGRLHQLERALAGVGTPEYDHVLRRALEEAHAVLVLNPTAETMLAPYGRDVCVVPWGMAPARFPWPPPDQPRDPARLIGLRPSRERSAPCGLIATRPSLEAIRP
jgi:hypothetical protein